MKGDLIGVNPGMTSLGVLPRFNLRGYKVPLTSARGVLV